MLARLRDILRSETARGYDDRTVMGGLEGLISRWRLKVASEVGIDDFRQPLLQVLEILGPYSRSATTERAQLAARVLEIIDPKAEKSRPHPASVPKAVPEMTRAPVVSPLSPSQPKRPARSVASPPKRTYPRDTSSSAASPRQTKRKPALGSGVDGDVTKLWGVSEVYANRLNKLGIRTIRDLLYHFPRRHVDYASVKQIRDLTVGEIESVRGTVWEVQNAKARSGMTITRAVIADETGTIHAIWFNQPFLSKTLQSSQEIMLSGRIDQNMGQLQLKSPDWEVVKAGETVHTGRMVPLYPLTEGITDRWLRSVTKRALDRWTKSLPDHLPESVRASVGLLPLPVAVSQMHFPTNEDMLSRATRRLAFDEFFVMQLAVQLHRRDWQKESGNAMFEGQDLGRGFVESLPFTLTGAQHRVIDEILDDMARPAPMSRLLQGEVGSGKTVVAATASIVAVGSGFQSVIMAPTEILAEQHFKTMCSLLGADVTALDENGVAEGKPMPGLGRGLRIGMVTGSVKKKQKEALCDQIAIGTVDIAVGTHALIQDDVFFNRLGLVIVDEQHRFGVMQRANLRQKGYNPDLLVMTATPIPRTLALTVYGDLDISVIDQLPPGRQEIKTVWLGPSERDNAYAFLHKQVQLGRQGFVICPLVEESEKIEAKAAVAEFERLRRNVLPDLSLGLLHGRLKGVDKEKVMGEFRNGEVDVLVSTAVVEVGIDVPNATVMLIEGADRFGLSQLHQFRGRVGRGQEKSYCLLLADSPSAVAEQRLAALAQTRDGFALAEEDLRLRGPGEFFGTRQSGMPDLKVAQYSDLRTLEEARGVAQKVFASNPTLEGVEYQLLRSKVDRFMAEDLDLD